MQITIIRHGKPDFDWHRRIKGSDFRQIEYEYDTAGIVDKPDAESRKLPDRHEFVVCSDFPRSIESAKALGATEIHLSSALFREMNPPYFNTVSLTMSLKHWVVVLRLLWFMGFSKNSESFVSARQRAATAAHRLIDLAQQYRRVLFVGHGMLNHYVAKELLVLNWVGPKNPGRDYWEFATYYPGYHHTVTSRQG